MPDQRHLVETGLSPARFHFFGALGLLLGRELQRLARSWNADVRSSLRLGAFALDIFVRGAQISRGGLRSISGRTGKRGGRYRCRRRAAVRAPRCLPDRRAYARHPLSWHRACLQTALQIVHPETGADGSACSCVSCDPTLPITHDCSLARNKDITANVAHSSFFWIRKA